MKLVYAHVRHDQVKTIAGLALSRSVTEEQLCVSEKNARLCSCQSEFCLSGSPVVFSGSLIRRRMSLRELISFDFAPSIP